MYKKNRKKEKKELEKELKKWEKKTWILEKEEINKKWEENGRLKEGWRGGGERTKMLKKKW